MKVTMIVPPSLDNEKPAERTAGCTRMVYAMPNIYELTVAAVLEKEQHHVVYMDFVQDKGTEEVLTNFISADQSDCYLIWSVNLSLQTDQRAMEIIRRIKPSVWIVLQGPGVTYYTKEGLRDDRTIVVRGEPEETVRELLAAIENPTVNWQTVPGISYIQNNLIKHNPSRPLIKNLDNLPFPARHFIEKYTFSNPKLKDHPYTTVLTSRNCPFHCIYCVPSSLTFAREIEYKKEHEKKPPVSFRSVENVVEELNMLAAKGYKSICFIDDNFITTSKRLKPICEVIKKHGFSWGCQARVDAISEEIAKLLGDANCGFVDLGVESFNDDILVYIKKGVTSAQIIEGIELLKKYKVPVKLNILIGTSPLETVKTVKDTLIKAKKLKVSQVMFNIVSPFPGTEFYEMAKQNGWIVGGEYSPTDVQRHSILSYPSLNSRQMEKLLFRNNLQFFLRPSFIWMHIRKFHSFRDFSIALKALKIKLFG